jgi:WD40 repeat protein
MRGGLWRILILGIALAIFSAEAATAQQTNDLASFSVRPHLANANNISGLAFSGDGTRLVSVAEDNAIYVWDVQVGIVIREIVKAGGVTGSQLIAFSPASNKLAVRREFEEAQEHIIRIWDIRSGQYLYMLKCKPCLLFDPLAFSPDGALLVTVEQNDERLPPVIAIRDAASGRVRFNLQHAGDKAAFAADGTLVTAGTGAEVQFWNTRTGAKIRAVTIKDKTYQSPTAIAISGDGSWFVTGANRNARNWGSEGDPPTNDVTGKPQTFVPVWNTRSGALIRMLKYHLNKVEEVGISPDDSVVASQGDDTRLWNGVSGKLIATFAGGTFAFSPDSSLIATVDNLSHIEIRDSHTGKIVRSLSQPGAAVNQVAFSPEGDRLAVASQSKAVQIWDLRAARLLRNVQQPDQAFSVAFSPDGTRLLVGNTGNPVTLWDANSGQLVRRLTGAADQVHHVAFSPSGGEVAVASALLTTIDLIDPETGRLIRRLKGLEHGSNALYYLQNGKSIAAVGGGVEDTCCDGPTVWDTASGRLLWKAKTDAGEGVFDLAISPDAKTLFYPEGPNIVQHDVKSGTKIRESETPSGIWSMALSADGGTLATGHEDYNIRLWRSPPDGKLVKTLSGHVGFVHTLRYSPNGKWLVSGSDDGSIKVWDARSGALLVTLLATADGEWLAMTPEGFFSASEHGAGLLQIVRNSEAYSVDQFFQILYRPDLVREKLAGDPDIKVKGAAEKLDLEKVLASGAAPTVAIVSPGGGSTQHGDHVTFEAHISPQAGGIGRVEWRVNGVTLAVQDNATGADPVAKEGTVRRTIVLGEGTNVVEVVAYNSQNLIASLPASIEVNVVLDTPQPPPRLYVLAVGISKYRDTALTLSFAAADAQSITQALASASGGLYAGDPIVVTRLDADATREKIESVFADFEKRMQTNDVFVLYIAGHGVTEEGKYNFLPYDFHFDDEDSIIKSGISQDQFQAWLARIPALRAVLIYDTCESGSAAADNSEFRADDKLIAVERLTRSMGRTILSASTDSAPAIEGYEGHGLFTFAVLDALSHADAKHTGTIKVSELANYLKDIVPELSLRAFHVRQTPQVKVSGGDFPLVKAPASGTLH